MQDLADRYGFVILARIGRQNDEAVAVGEVLHPPLDALAAAGSAVQQEQERIRRARLRWDVEDAVALRPEAEVRFSMRGDGDPCARPGAQTAIRDRRRL